jgi:hypothetical protein
VGCDARAVMRSVSFWFRSGSCSGRNVNRLCPVRPRYPSSLPCARMTRATAVRFGRVSQSASGGHRSAARRDLPGRWRRGRPRSHRLRSLDGVSVPAVDLRHLARQTGRRPDPR